VTVETQYVGPDAVGALVSYTRTQGLNRFTLVADERTWPAMGEVVHTALTADAADVQVTLLSGEEVVADGERVLEIMLPGDQNDRTFLAVGAGTITDLTRFVSHRLACPFISLPTAPSVDAYTSANAPLVVHRFKRTIDAQEPIAVFADIDVLCQAPSAMVAAGVGDILGKYTALADWRLGALLWDEEIDQDVVDAMYRVLHNVAGQIEGIGRREAAAVAGLMQGLLDSGTAMARWVNSRPASGSEHHLSHYWEMLLLQQGRPAMLHGAKVGVATVLMARSYRNLLDLSVDEVRARLERTPHAAPDELRIRIRAGYGPLAEQVIAEHAEALEILPVLSVRMRTRLVDHWDAVQAIAADVPPPDEIVAKLRAVGAPVNPADLGFTALETDDALRYAHFMRSRLTVRWVERALGLL
jgi:glycerol-1-phosphate dehydrogenase [NAD(P)+]